MVIPLQTMLCARWIDSRPLPRNPGTVMSVARFYYRRLCVKITLFQHCLRPASSTIQLPCGDHLYADAMLRGGGGGGDVLATDDGFLRALNWFRIVPLVQLRSSSCLVYPPTLPSHCYYILSFYSLLPPSRNKKETEAQKNQCVFTERTMVLHISRVCSQQVAASQCQCQRVPPPESHSSPSAGRSALSSWPHSKVFGRVFDRRVHAHRIRLRRWWQLPTPDTCFFYL